MGGGTEVVPSAAAIACSQLDLQLQARSDGIDLGVLSAQPASPLKFEACIIERKIVATCSCCKN